MDPQEILKVQENISKSLEALSENLVFSPDYFSSLLDACCKTFQAIDSFDSLLAPLSDAVSQIQRGLSDLSSKIDFQKIIPALSLFEQLQERTPDSSSVDQISLDQSVVDSSVEAVRRIEPYLSSDTKAKFGKTILPRLKDKTHLSLNDVLAALGILITIFFNVLALIPDKQLDTIISQNEIIIEQHNDIMRLQENDKDGLLDALEAITDSINLLSDEVNLFCQEVEDSDNIPRGSSQLDAE